MGKNKKLDTVSLEVQIWASPFIIWAYLGPNSTDEDFILFFIVEG